jgi:hypothetical protein
VGLNLFMQFVKQTNRHIAWLSNISNPKINHSGHKTSNYLCHLRHIFKAETGP